MKEILFYTKTYFFVDLSPLDNLSYLLELDVSNNKIRKLFDFWPPCNLKEADFSFNLIEEIKNLDNFHYLQKLILDSMNIFSTKLNILFFRFSSFPR